MCACSRPLWVSPVNSPVRLGVSPTAASTPTGVYSQRFEALFPLGWNSGLHSLSHSPLVPPGLSAHDCGQWKVHNPLPRWIHQPPPCRESSLPISAPPTIWMNVSSLTPWLSDSPTVRFSVNSGCFLFLNLLLTFFWLCEEAQCVYLCLHLRQ